MSLFDFPTEDINFKYSNLELLNKTSFDEIKKDVENFKPCGTPIVDMIMIKNVGSFVTAKVAMLQWQLCPDLIKDIYNEFDVKFPDFTFDYLSLKNISNKLINENKSPVYIEIEIDGFMRQIFKSKYFDTSPILDKKYDYEYNFNFYLENVNLASNIVKDILSKYKEEWVNIQNNFNKIFEIIENNFEDVEEDEKYITSENMIDKINEEAKLNIEHVLPIYLEKLKLKYQSESENKNPFNKNLIMDKYYKEIQEEFSEKINEIYYLTLKKLNFDDDWCKKLITFFENEKFVHKMALSIDVMHLMLRNI